MQKRTIRGRQAVGDLISKHLLEVMAMVMTAHVMVDMRAERPVRRGEAALMRADNEAPVAWVKRCRGGGEEAGASGGVDENDGSLRSERGVVFSGKACTGDRQPTGGRTDEVERRADPRETKSRTPRTLLAGSRSWGAGSSSCLRRYCAR